MLDLPVLVEATTHSGRTIAAIKMATDGNAWMIVGVLQALLSISIFSSLRWRY
jgi:hypothetical protein